MLLREPAVDRPDLVCLSHLRWGFVYQRPQHLMSRFGRRTRVFFFEEPVFDEAHVPAAVRVPRLDLEEGGDGVVVARPSLPAGLSRSDSDQALATLLKALLREAGSREPVLWYYTPLALRFTGRVEAAAVVYDCMDDLAGFKGAPRELPERERELIGRADVVFTGGRSLYEAKRALHPRVHVFPSSVDVEHFRRSAAAGAPADPADQAAIPHPRLGYLGVIDERLDPELVDYVARARPEWHIVMLGPVVKVDPASLPRRSNIHYLGAKPYESLPAYLAGWDVALMPFALNQATRFISPTKTPEYLAAGCPVVSTPLPDVVRPWGEMGVVRVSGTHPGFVREIAEALARDRQDRGLARAVEAALRDLSWDRTWQAMDTLLAAELDRRRRQAEPAFAAERTAPPGEELRP